MAKATQEARIEIASVDDVQRHGTHLFAAHVAELEPAMADDLAPDWEKYQVAEVRGELIVLAAWSPEGAGPPFSDMIGYAVAGLSMHPHYASLLVCQQDLLFVEKAWRNQRVGLRLIAHLTETARARGAHHLLMHAKTGSQLEKLLPRLGFKAEETTFKELLCPQD